MSSTRAYGKNFSNPRAFAIFIIIYQSGFASPGGSHTLKLHCTLLSALVIDPSSSAQHAAGRTTSAYSAVSVKNMSWTTKKSNFDNAFLT